MLLLEQREREVAIVAAGARETPGSRPVVRGLRKSSMSKT
jgi:hypothetical protein